MAMTLEKFKSELIGILVTLVIGLVLVILNPSAGEHRQSIREIVAEDHPIASLLGGGIVASVLPGYKSYTIASAMRFDGEVVSVGFAGHVWVRRNLLGN